jgi:ABC-2 type transport system permease protein
MHGLYAVFRKELSDHFSSNRFVILFALIAMVSFITSYMAAVQLRSGLEGAIKPKFIFLLIFTSPGALFSMAQFVAFFGPLIGIVLGFDAINRERAHGTLIKLVTQPIYRDAVINGKFLAGVTVIAIMMFSLVLVISGFGLALIGVVPGAEEIFRLLAYIIISIFYVSFWLGVSILFSITLRSVATSALASIALWIFLSFFISIGADLIANAVAPLEGQKRSNPATVVRHAEIKQKASLFSPMVLFTDATGIIVDPTRKTTSAVVLMGPMEEMSMSRFQSPLALGQSILMVYPHLTALIAITLLCFGISYLVFMLQEIRS